MDHPNPHVRTAAAALAGFSACNFAGPLLSAGILWNRERLPALNADLFGDEEARGTALGPRRKKSENRPGGLAQIERVMRFLRAPLGEGGRLRGEGEDGPNFLHAGDGFRAGAKAQAQLATEIGLECGWGLRGGRGGRGGGGGGRAKTAQTFCTRAMASGRAQKRKRSLQRKRLMRPARCTSNSRYFLKRAVRSSGEKHNPLMALARL